MKNCQPKILEPLMKLEVVTPEENMGDVIGDLNKRRALIEGTDERSGKTVVNAKVLCLNVRLRDRPPHVDLWPCHVKHELQPLR